MPDSAQITCPRCGYDLSGAFAAAQAAPEPKPTQGTCSECGLNFAWEEVTSGKLHTPRFSYEHGTPFNLVRFFRTFSRSTDIWRLWGPLKMTHEIRPGRLAVFALLSLLVLHLAAATLVLSAAWCGYASNWIASTKAAQDAAFVASLNTGGPAAAIPPPHSPIMFTSPTNGIVTIDDLAPLLIWPYQHSPTFVPSRGPVTLSLDLEPMFAAVFTLLGPAVLLLLLRQTRRQFRLRKLHLWRAVCLAAPMLFSTLVLANLVVVLAARGFLSVPWLQNSMLLPVVIGILCYFCYHTAWWWAFARRYLHAPHALGIAVAGVSIGALCFALIAIAVHSRLMYDLLW